MTDRTRDRVRIFDTTLRDGEQSPGISLNIAEKLEIARARATRRRRHRGRLPDRLARRLRGGAGDRRARSTGATGLGGLARCNDRDIDRAWEAVQYAPRPRIHVFLSTSAIHASTSCR